MLLPCNFCYFQQLSSCDIAAIQEYMDLPMTTIEKLRLEMVARTGHQFAVVLSPRVGKNKAFEQYVFLYRYFSNEKNA